MCYPLSLFALRAIFGSSFAHGWLKDRGSSDLARCLRLSCQLASGWVWGPESRLERGMEKLRFFSFTLLCQVSSWVPATVPPWSRSCQTGPLVSSLPQVTPLPRFWNNYHLPLSFWPRRRRVPVANVLVATWTSIWLLGFAILGVTKSIPHSYIQGISWSWLGLISTSSKSERRLIAHLLLCWHSFSFPVVSLVFFPQPYLTFLPRKDLKLGQIEVNKND